MGGGAVGGGASGVLINVKVNSRYVEAHVERGARDRPGVRARPDRLLHEIGLEDRALRLVIIGPGVEMLVE